MTGALVVPDQKTFLSFGVKPQNWVHGGSFGGTF